MNMSLSEICSKQSNDVIMEEIDRADNIKNSSAVAWPLSDNTQKDGENAKIDTEKDLKCDKNSTTFPHWKVRTCLSQIKAPSPTAHAFLRRRKSQDSHIKLQTSSNKSGQEFRRALAFNAASSPSAYFQTSKKQSNSELEINGDQENNPLKRCNSAPVLNDLDMDIIPVDWQQNVLSNNTGGRTRRFSATVVSVNSSPIAGTARSTSRLRLHQLRSEESLEGIQSKETAHEREVQANIQITSNCGDMSISDRRHPSWEGFDALSPNSKNSPPASEKNQFPVPVTVPKSNHNRSNELCNISPGCLSPTLSHLSHPTSGGIPSPLTFSPSPCIANFSPLPPSPTRGICGTGKQCFSPSMQVPMSLARASSRSPSPSPTRRNFVARRRSQSPCIMRPSALGSIKRKCDSDNEGNSSPKRRTTNQHIANNTHLLGVNMETGSTHTLLFHQRNLIQRSHSLSSSSVDSTDMYNSGVSPSSPNHPSYSQPHPISGFQHPLHQTSTPLHLHGTSGAQLPLPDHGNRCSSPTSSTCSSSSLEGILPTLNSPNLSYPRRPLKDTNDTTSPLAKEAAAI